MENRQNAWEMAKQRRNRKYRLLLIAVGIVFALSVIAGIILGQFYIPLGCIFVLGGILLLSLRFTSGGEALPVYAYIAFTVMLIVGAVLLYKGLVSGVNRQDDLQYTQSLGVSAEELLATTNSEGTQYAVILDGVLSRRLLPEAYQAQRAEDIGAVLIIHTTHRKVGSYTNGGTAYRTDLSISLKSLKTGETISSTSISGDDPPKHIRVSPLDPNTDRYGNPPSDEQIKKTCVSMIEKAKIEEQRKSRVTILSEEELLVFFRRIIAKLADDDGWAEVNRVDKEVKEAEPDFSIEDYGYKSLMLYFKNDPHYAVKERDWSNTMVFLTSLDYVRWTGE